MCFHGNEFRNAPWLPLLGGGAGGRAPQVLPPAGHGAFPPEDSEFGGTNSPGREGAWSGQLWHTGACPNAHGSLDSQ